MRDPHAYGFGMPTIGEHLAPTGPHLPVARYIHPDTFRMYETKAKKMGFTGTACA